MPVFDGWFWPPSRERNALIWWGSFPDGGGATLGDIHAIENLSDKLRGRRYRHVIVSTLPMTGRFQTIARTPAELRPGARTFIFVCGPLIGHQQMQDLLSTGPAARKFAAGVTVLDTQAAFNAAFDGILARDGQPDSAFDLALARFAGVEAPAPPPDGPVALCLLGAPSQLPSHAAAARLLREAIAETGVPTMTIDTVIHPISNTPDKILRDFLKPSSVATTRLHGALYALACGRPAIAIDQVPGGSKVSANLKKIGWPLVFRADQVEAADIRRAFAMAMSDDIIPIVARCRADAIRRSVDALERAADMIAGRRGRSR